MINVGVLTFQSSDALTALQENVGKPIASLLLVALHPGIDNNIVNLQPEALHYNICLPECVYQRNNHMFPRPIIPRAQ